MDAPTLPSADDPATFYRDLAAALEGLVAGEPDPVANMANAAALIFEAVPRLNWAGFYRNLGGELVLGPFQGRAACIRIPFGKGVCGAAAATLQVQRVDDVHAFPGHIACDAASESELVVPIVGTDGVLIAVLDLDSPERARFDADDEAGFVAIGAILANILQLSRSSRSSLRPPGMIITGHGSLPASVPLNAATSAPG